MELDALRQDVPVLHRVLSDHAERAPFEVLLVGVLAPLISAAAAAR